MKVTYSRKGKRRTVGIPGTGLFYTETEKYDDKVEDAPPATNGRFLRVLFYVMLGVLLFFVMKVMLAR